MTPSTHGLGLAARVAAEHRRPLTWLGLTCAAGVLVYAFVVYPLDQRVANIEQRDRAAAQALAAASVELNQATGTLTGKARASAELTTFYQDVLPRDLSGARRLTYLRLARLARETNLNYERASYTPSKEVGETLTRLDIQLVLSGAYSDIRAFIHEIEAAPEFIVIDNIQLGEGGDPNSLVVTLQLSTYYREAPAS